MKIWLEVNNKNYDLLRDTYHEVDRANPEFPRHRQIKEFLSNILEDMQTGLDSGKSFEFCKHKE